MDTLFFYLSKIGWTFVQPDILFFYLLLLATVLLWLNKVKTAKRIFTFLTVLVLVVGLAPIGYFLNRPLENRFTSNPTLPGRVDGIILLGGTIQPAISFEWNQVALGTSAEREIAFATLANQYPNARLLMSGGSGNIMNQEHREADLSPRLLRDLNVDTSRVVFERDSRNTYENALNSKPLMQPKPGETWVLVTSAAHMPRAVGVFCAQQWPVIPWPVDFKTTQDNLGFFFNFANRLDGLNQILHEWAGLVSYRLTGKTEKLLPLACPLS